MKSVIKRLIRNGADWLFFIYLNSLNLKEAIPLKKWIKIRNLFTLFKSAKDPLFNKRRTEICVGSDLTFLPPGAMPKDAVIGVWTMSREVMEFILKDLLSKKPEVIIECGSGLSTILLAHYASLVKADGVNVLVVSLEQDEKEVAKNTSRLQALNLDKHTTIIHSPIDAKGNYTLDEKQILSATNNKKADCLIIDGPSGPDGCRISTLPLLSSCSNENAIWYLDDALRDGELNALISWADAGKASVEGIYPFNKGLAVGRLNC